METGKKFAERNKLIVNEILTGLRSLFVERDKLCCVQTLMCPIKVNLEFVLPS